MVNIVSNINREKEYDNLTDWLEFATRQVLKDLYTVLPAIIESYNVATKRAKVKIALTQMSTAGKAIEYPIIADVPVIFLACSEYIIQFPLKSGDNVLIVFSQRGLDKFKVTYKQEQPSLHGFFSMADAIAIPGFGTLSNNIADPDALNIQTTNGQTYMTLKNDIITINATNVIINATTTTINSNVNVVGNVDVTGTLNTDVLKIDDIELPSDHKHGGVQIGTGETGTPIA